MRVSNIVRVYKKQHDMWKIILGLATLYIGTQAECKSIAASMQDAGEGVKACELSEGEVTFNVL